MSTASILSATRTAMKDQGDEFTSSFPGDGATQLIELPQELVDPASLAVYLINPQNQSTLLTQGSQPGLGDYALFERSGQLWMNQPVQIGYQLLVNGTYYTLFTNDDLTYHVQTAFLQHTHNREPPVYLDAPDPTIETPIFAQLPLPEVEEYIVALTAAVMAIRSEVVEAGHEYNILTPDSVSIPRGERYRHLTDLYDRLDQQRKDLAMQLNVGFERIEITDLRRVSRTTNRYVPRYKPREFDDRRWPQRIIPEIDVGPQARVFTYRGWWDPSVQFYTNDVVDRDAGERFRAVRNNINIDPIVDVNNAATPGYGANWIRTPINTGYGGPSW